MQLATSLKDAHAIFNGVIVVIVQYGECTGGVLSGRLCSLDALFWDGPFEGQMASLNFQGWYSTTAGYHISTWIPWNAPLGWAEICQVQMGDRQGNEKTLHKNRMKTYPSVAFDFQPLSWTHTKWSWTVFYRDNDGSILFAQECTSKVTSVPCTISMYIITEAVPCWMKWNL